MNQQRADKLHPVFFSQSIPPLKRVLQAGGPSIQTGIVFCDRKLKAFLPEAWLRDPRLKFYYLTAGEQSKSLENLPKHIDKILSLDEDFDRSQLLFIGMGGGSIIDLTGFLATVYKRGLPVVYFPSTYLSALDSAHGGKTALNFKNIKNLLGSYHFPKAVFVVRDFLKNNPQGLKNSALGELVKMAFIAGGKLYQSLKEMRGQQRRAPLTLSNSSIEKPSDTMSKTSPPLTLSDRNRVSDDEEKEPRGAPLTLSDSSIEKLLQLAVIEKMKIVSKDPFESRFIRQKLNLGHTVGHPLEALCSLPHGMAVARGLLFSLSWSLRRRFLSSRDFEEMKNLIPPLERKIKKLSLLQFKEHLKRDKKHRRGDQLDFVFIKKPGEVFLKSVSIEELLAEALRQKLI